MPVIFWASQELCTSIIILAFTASLNCCTFLKINDLNYYLWWGFFKEWIDLQKRDWYLDEFIIIIFFNMQHPVRLNKNRLFQRWYKVNYILTFTLQKSRGYIWFHQITLGIFWTQMRTKLAYKSQLYTERALDKTRKGTGFSDTWQVGRPV